MRALIFMTCMALIACATGSQSKSTSFPYPPDAYDHQIEGDVEMLLTLRDDGTVESVEVVSGPGYGLNEAAVEQVRKMKFGSPADGGAHNPFEYIYRFRFD